MTGSAAWSGAFMVSLPLGRGVLWPHARLPCHAARKTTTRWFTVSAWLMARSWRACRTNLVRGHHRQRPVRCLPGNTRGTAGHWCRIRGSEVERVTRRMASPVKPASLTYARQRHRRCPAIGSPERTKRRRSPPPHGLMRLPPTHYDGQRDTGAGPHRSRRARRPPTGEHPAAPPGARCRRMSGTEAAIDRSRVPSAAKQAPGRDRPGCGLTADT